MNTQKMLNAWRAKLEGKEIVKRMFGTNNWVICKESIYDWKPLIFEYRIKSEIEQY